MHRRLILRPGAIGDCLLSLPALEHLVTGYTEIWISLPVAPLIDFADRVRPLSSTGIDLVGIGDLDIPVTLREELASFDSVVSWYGTQRPDFRRALQNLAPHCEFFEALPPADYVGHATDFFAEQVGAPMNLVPRVNVAAASPRGTVVIHPFSGSQRKNWPLSRARELAAKLPCPVEWIAGPEDPFIDAQRFGNLRELASWLTGASLFIGNDSGITHLAAAAGVNTLALFGPSDPAKWAPRGANVTVLRSDPVETLRVETVLEAANRLQD